MKLNEREREKERERQQLLVYADKRLLKHKINTIYKNAEDQIKRQYGALLTNKPREKLGLRHGAKMLNQVRT